MFRMCILLDGNCPRRCRPSASNQSRTCGRSKWKDWLGSLKIIGRQTMGSSSGRGGKSLCIPRWWTMHRYVPTSHPMVISTSLISAVSDTALNIAHTLAFDISAPNPDHTLALDTNISSPLTPANLSSLAIVAPNHSYGCTPLHCGMHQALSDVFAQSANHLTNHRPSCAHTIFLLILLRTNSLIVSSNSSMMPASHGPPIVSPKSPKPNEEDKESGDTSLIKRALPKVSRTTESI